MNKRFSALILSLLLLLSVVLCACSNNETDPTLSADATYKVTVVDGLGNPYTEKVVVKLKQNDTQVAMGAINAQGVFEKVLPRGEYTVEVVSTNTDLKCQYIVAPLTKEVTEVQAVMAYAPTDTREIGVSTGEMDGDGNPLNYQAGIVSVGSSYIALDSDGRTYVTFSPTEAGLYEFTVVNDDASVGYYGSPYFVQENNVAENVKGNSFTISVDAGMIGNAETGTSVLVIGLDAAEGKTGCILNICRTGAPTWSVENEPWKNYQPEMPIKDFTLDSDVELVDFDVTAATDTYKLVLNETDGCYRLGSVDGPKVYVRLGVAVYGICMKDMVGEIIYDADGILMQTGTSPFRYMYDNGKEDFFKEDYTDVMRQIVTAADKATGVYPLTKDLYYMLPLGVENKGWCIENSINYLFRGVDGVNSEISWMFLLCHEEGDITGGTDTDEPVGPVDPVEPNPVDPKPPVTPTPSGPVEDNKDEPIEIGSTLEFSADVKANHIVYFDIYRVNDTTLTIHSKDAYVIYNGRTYEAKNGVVSVPNLYSQYINIPVSIQIGNKGTKDANFTVTLSYPEGHSENPYKLSTGALSTKQKSGDADGTFYTFTATSAGKLTITVVDTTKGTFAGISITKVVDGIPTYISLEDNATSISVDLVAGETVTVNICASSSNIGTYPNSTIKTNVTFE